MAQTVVFLQFSGLLGFNSQFYGVDRSNAVFYKYLVFAPNNRSLSLVRNQFFVSPVKLAQLPISHFQNFLPCKLAMSRLYLATNTVRQSHNFFALAWYVIEKKH